MRTHGPASGSVAGFSELPSVMVPVTAVVAAGVGSNVPLGIVLTIEMVPTEQVAQVVAQVGGPPEYIRENWDRLVGTAQHLAELKAGAG